ncbi:DUF1236 domain-containing protein [Bradyrhizobium archetypum]|uniref:DUF1236 domain-containing protein n=1 Tax=Bradyrhizobium archetypum TaxID=2721160 RepID=A0A7Y4M0Y3_9BRAD|nr:DUF1236 domain-containing protein [Bradyrhizobium archetypum]NOJ45809.1 DUF1236 domain-containing protein [Bradyrhizobium archetypum]
MKNSLLAGAIAGLMLGTSAFAQSPSDQQRTNAPSAQNQSPKAAPSPATPPDTPSGRSDTQQQPTNATADSPRPQAQSNQPAASQSGAASQTRSDGNAANPPAQQQQAQQPSQQPSQAQQPGASSQPSQAQTNTAPPASNQSTSTQQSTGPANTTNSGSAQPSANTAAQPSNTQTNTAQSRTNVNVSANLTESQRTRVSTSISRLNVKPVTNVNFSLSVGTVVPRDVHFEPLPAEVVEVMPQYRGYNFILVREDIVIVDPATYKIVDVLPRGGQSTAAAPTPRKETFSDRDREVVRKHARSSRTEQRSTRTEQRTTGSATSTRVRVGDRLPDSVEIRSFPDEVYRESPRLREYRYIERDDRMYIIEPGERRIIEEIDD